MLKIRTTLDEFIKELYENNDVVTEWTYKMVLHVTVKRVDNDKLNIINIMFKIVPILNFLQTQIPFY